MHRVAFAAVATVALASLMPVAPAAPTPDAGTREPAASTYRVVASINRTEVVAGEDTVRITGKVRPGAAGQEVVLQQRRDDTTRWVKTGTARIKRTGRFVLEDDPSRAGVRYYRVLKPAADGIKAGRSRGLRLDVWGWEPLTGRTPSAGGGVILTTTTIGIEDFDRSIQLITPGRVGSVEYVLDGMCRSLRATYALADISGPGASGSVTVSLDGAAVVTHLLDDNTIVYDHVVDVSRVVRIRFDLSASVWPAGSTAVGSPEVLCLP